jgi:hypothetical protein
MGLWTMSEKIDRPGQLADIIERFLSGASRYPQEFNDFFECVLSDPKLDVYSKRCEILHSEFEPHRGEDPQQKAQREAAAVIELENMVVELRLLERQGEIIDKRTGGIRPS